MRMQGVIIECVVVVAMSTKITISRDLATWATDKHNQSIKFGGKLSSMHVLQIDGYSTRASQSLFVGHIFLGLEDGFWTDITGTSTIT
jgi:hypothetical protein